MQAPVFKTLNTPEVRNYVGNNPTRIYAYGKSLRGVLPPFIVWKVISSAPYCFVGGTKVGDRVQVQIDCYSKEDNILRQLSNVVGSVLLEADVQSEKLNAKFNDELNLHQISLIATFTQSK